MAENGDGIKTFLTDLVKGGERLPTGYAYLIRSGVRMPELYPLLGELLFPSLPPTDKRTVPAVPNVIGMFIDDSPANMLRIIWKLPDEELPSEKVYTEFAQDVDKWNKKHLNSFSEKTRIICLPQRACWMDTAGEFYGTHGTLPRLEDATGDTDRNWFAHQVVGAGNPMGVFRFFRIAQKKVMEGEGQSKNVPTVYLLNSLSNLYRNLGLGETAALLKTLLNASTWSDPRNVFFAVIQEGVMNESEVNYLESFFDGIIKLKAERFGDWPVISLTVDSLPSIEKLRKLPPKLVYTQRWPKEDTKKIGEKLGLSPLSHDKVKTHFIHVFGFSEIEQEKAKSMSCALETLKSFSA